MWIPQLVLFMATLTRYGTILSSVLDPHCFYEDLDMDLA
jgi:hypothetical protein